MHDTMTETRAPAELAKTAMITCLSISHWTGRRTDREVTRKVHEQYHARDDAGRYNKVLIDKRAFADIQACVSKARQAHYDLTLPWLDTGGRIMSVHHFEEYERRMRGYAEDFEAAVRDFLGRYEDWKADAERRLNGMYRDADYPSRQELATKFSFETWQIPVPDAADFRVAIGQVALERARAEIKRKTEEAVRAAQQDPWRRIAETVGHMADRLAAYKPGGDGEKAEGVFRDSLVENVRDLVRVLPGLNLTSDPALDRIAERMKALCETEAAVLREVDPKRKEVAGKAQEILSDVQAFLQ